MDAQVIRVLEFDKIVNMLAERAACSLGQERAASLVPMTDVDVIRRMQAETSEAKSVLQMHGTIPLGGITDIRPLVHKAELGAMLQPREIADIAQTLSAARRLRSFLMKHREDCPLLTGIAGGMGVFEPIEQEAARCISPGGEIVDAASEGLARVRSEMKATHARIMERLNLILQSRQHRSALQEPLITQREDRYCIPVKVEYRSQIRGIVHDASSSGATVFVEPEQVVEPGNDLKRLAARERDEVEKVLLKLSARIAAASQDILSTVEIVAHIDFVSAKAKLSAAQDASEPALNREGRLNLIQARHPLLSGDVVPVDVQLGTAFRALLITGPNTGGKTVTLKTIGLLTLMAQAGLHVPAAPGTDAAVFDQVFADIGDEQSIEQSLSTFSSHVQNIVRVVRAAERNALVLLDEIGAGTDPAEGAALARAILNYLLDRDVRLVATTHYGELKEFAFVRDGVQNASVEFDVQTLRPTFRLMMGVPGSSNAFAIASRLGMPEAIVEGAQDSLAGRRDGADEVIHRIEESHLAAIEEHAQARRSSAEAETLRRRYEEQLRKLESVRAKVEDEVRGRAKQLIDHYTRKLERSLKELAETSREGRRSERIKKEARESLDKVREELIELPELVDEGPVDGHVYRKGDPVRIANLNQEGVLVAEVSGDGQAMVLIGVMKVMVPITSLRPATGAQKESGTAAPSGTGISLSKAENVSPELKLIAQRAELALHNLERYLDDAHAAGLTQVRIIHGKGTGALRFAVWEFLKDHPAVESYRLGEQSEGGSGATVVMLK
ncbi:MAG: endonuclease MutS2 [Armatimonadetes bacterium]|nr:endonuclease MutS2 [Armatimonadota bacterium]